MDANELQIHPPMPRRKDFRIGVLGSGFIVSECHLPAYRKAGFNVAAIASRTRERAEAAAKRHGIAKVCESAGELLDDASIEVLDIAVPPDAQVALIKAACARRTVKGILAQKPLAVNYAEAVEAVESCEAAGITLAVNQNMRYDQSVRAARTLLNRRALGDPVFATIDMRGIPHWMPWQSGLGWVTLRIMSIHHLDCFRYWFGDPERIICSTRSDPRTQFPHNDGIATYILEYADGLRCVGIDDTWTGPAKEGCPADFSIRWRIEGLAGLAMGELGWVKTPYTSPSTMQFAMKGDVGFRRPVWGESWFPDAFAGTMAQLLIALETNTAPAISGRDNLVTMALVDAAYRSAEEHRAVALDEVLAPPPMKPMEREPRLPSFALTVTESEQTSLPAVIESPLKHHHAPRTGLTAHMSRRAMQAVEYASVACEQLGHHAIGTEHLLLGLAEQGSPSVASVLRQAGLTLSLVQRAVEEEVGSRPPFQRIDPPSLTSVVKHVLQRATEEADALGAPVAGPEHILLAMLRENDGIGPKILNRFGVTLASAEETIRRMAR